MLINIHLTNKNKASAEIMEHLRRFNVAQQFANPTHPTPPHPTPHPSPPPNQNIDEIIQISLHSSYFIKPISPSFHNQLLRGHSASKKAATVLGKTARICSKLYETYFAVVCLYAGSSFKQRPSINIGSLI